MKLHQFKINWKSWCWWDIPVRENRPFMKLFFSCYAHINQDTLKTFPKCLAATQKALASSHSCVIDNTNASIEKRAHFIELTRKHNAKVRCLIMEACENPMLAEHLNLLRGYRGGRLVPEIAFRVFKYEPVTLNEGFDEIVHVPFVPRFQNRNEKREFEMIFVAEK